MCGVGPVKKGLKGIRDSYSLSFKAMKVGYTLSRNQLLYFYKKLEPYCELEKILVSPSEHVFTSVLGAVKNQELLDTLDYVLRVRGQHGTCIRPDVYPQKYSEIQAEPASGTDGT